MTGALSPLAGGERPWGRMGDALVRLARADQRLAGLETPVRVELHERAVWYAIGSS